MVFQLRCLFNHDLCKAVIPARDVPDMPGDAVDARPQGFSELAGVGALARLYHAVVSDAVVFGKKAERVLRHPDTLLRHGVEKPVGNVTRKRDAGVNVEV